MVIDTSAVVAILKDEPEANDFALLIRRAPTRWMSTSTYFEAGIVVDQLTGRAPDDTKDRLGDLLRSSGIMLVPFSEAHAEIAREAYRRYGRGRHKADLNFGDCMSYALAKSLDEPLLFKGTDFSLTDVQVAR
jgi:ribonuclease VapC